MEHLVFDLQGIKMCVNIQLHAHFDPQGHLQPPQHAQGQEPQHQHPPKGLQRQFYHILQRKAKKSHLTVYGGLEQLHHQPHGGHHQQAHDQGHHGHGEASMCDFLTDLRLKHDKK